MYGIWTNTMLLLHSQLSKVKIQFAAANNTLGGNNKKMKMQATDFILLSFSFSYFSFFFLSIFSPYNKPLFLFE